MSNPTTTAVVPTSKGDQLLENASTLVTRLGDIHSKLLTVLQRVGLGVESNLQAEAESGLGYLGRMDVSLRLLYDLADDIEKQVDALEEAF